MKVKKTLLLLSIPLLLAFAIIVFIALPWTVNSKSDNFIKGCSFVLNWRHVS